jgi:hypothetical protein
LRRIELRLKRRRLLVRSAEHVAWAAGLQLALVVRVGRGGGGSDKSTPLAAACLNTLRLVVYG